MKRKTLSTLAAVGALVVLSGIPAFATIPGEMHTKVPFEFRVEGKTLPAGDYVITNPANNVNVLEIRNQNGAPAVLAFTEPVSAPDGGIANAHLVFDRVGRIEYLVQVWSGAETQGDRIIGAPTPSSR